MRIGKTLKKKTETYRRRPDSLVRFWRYINQHLLTYLFMTTTNTKCCFGAVGESDQRVEQPSDRALLLVTTTVTTTTTTTTKLSRPPPRSLRGKLRKRIRGSRYQSGC